MKSEWFLDTEERINIMDNFEKNIGLSIKVVVHDSCITFQKLYILYKIE